ncbi:MAG: hypothetical protein AAFV72_11365 [Cyanobacteria bacterium J06635_1]
MLDNPPPRPDAAVQPANSQVRLIQTSELLVAIAGRNDLGFLGIAGATLAAFLYVTPSAA